MVKLLVDKGADLNYKHPLTKLTALQLAAYGGYEEVVKYLAGKGADINSKMRGNVSIVRVCMITEITKWPIYWFPLAPRKTAVWKKVQLG